MGGREEEGRSLAETPTWAVATVITFMVTIGFLIHGGLVKFGKWLDRTKRKQLLAALDKIKEELMVFGLLSLLMGHWIVFVAKICVKSSAVSSRFYPCVASNYVKHEGFENQAVDLRSNHLNSSTARLLLEDVHQGFCPQLILLVGTKLHRIVVKLAVEVVNSSHWTGFEQFNPRDELFWFGNPRLLLLLIQFISFQNAFEMATYIWSMWEIKDSSCFIGDRTFLITRLTFGIVSQFWCSFITFPLYVIVAQMGSKFKKTIVSENVRKSLHGWRRKVKTRHGGQPFRMLTMPSPVVNEGDENLESVSSTKGGRSTRFEGRFTPNQNLSLGQSEPNEVSSFNEKLQDQVCSAPQDEYSDERYDQEIKPSDDIDDHPVLPSKEQLN
ncbi:UNVERIFIED_CONTAM: MLO-like protein 4 [Sesamum radiatum]|uniref:MLO-like protein 4 n=1 Tax=Sesamum radiatum TaxID=300843 RepID=A0AAW2MWT9_SESRA